MLASLSQIHGLCSACWGLFLPLQICPPACNAMSVQETKLYANEIDYDLGCPKGWHAFYSCSQVLHLALPHS